MKINWRLCRSIVVLRMMEWTLRIRLALLCVMFGSLVVGYVLLLNPAMHQHDVLSGRALRFTLDLKHQEKTLLQEVYLNQQFEMHRQKFLLLMQLLPVTKQRFDLFESMTNLARSEGLVIELLSPETESIQSFYIAMPLRLIVVGTYAQFFRYVTRLMTLKWLITIPQLEIAPYSKVDLLRMNMLINVYRKNE